MSALHIGRLSNRYRVGDAAAGETLRRRLDELAAARLPGLLQDRLDRLLQRLGWPAPALVAVRRLNLRLRLAAGACAEDPAAGARIAAAWSDALIRGLARLLQASGVGAGGELVSDTLAVFPDRAGACRSHLRARLASGASPWWSAALLGEAARPAAAGALLDELSAARPQAAAELILELALQAGPDWSGRLAAADCRRPAARLLQGAAVLAVGPRDRPGTGAAGLSGVLDALAPAERRALADCAHPPSAALLLAAMLLLRRHGVPAGGPIRWEQLLLSRMGSQRWRLAAAAAAAATPSDRPPVAAGRDHAVRTEADPAAARPYGTAPHRAGRGGGAPEAAGATELGVPVGCSGLLFLIRFALRQPRAEDLALGPAMLALGGHLLDGLFQRLAPAAARAAWRRDGPLLQVFAGLREVPGDPRAASLGGGRQARDWAESVAVGLRALVGPEIGAAPRGAAYVLGTDCEALTPLDRLLLRPGRLHLTATEARLYLPATAIDIGLRRGGWDLDPGWVPPLGRVIRFEYRDPAGA